MSKPQFLIWSSKNGWNREYDFRFADDEQHAKNRITGVLRSYPDAEIKVYRLNLDDDVTADFLLGDGE